MKFADKILETIMTLQPFLGESLNTSAPADLPMFQSMFSCSDDFTTARQYRLFVFSKSEPTCHWYNSNAFRNNSNIAKLSSS